MIQFVNEKLPPTKYAKAVILANIDAFSMDDDRNYEHGNMTPAEQAAVDKQLRKLKARLNKLLR